MTGWSELREAQVHTVLVHRVQVRTTVSQYTRQAEDRWMREKGTQGNKWLVDQEYKYVLLCHSTQVDFHRIFFQNRHVDGFSTMVFSG